MRNAFSHELGRNRSLFAVPVEAGNCGGVMTVVCVIIPVAGLSTLISAIWASRNKFLFIKLSSIYSARSSFIPGVRPRSNLKATAIAKTAIMTIIEISIVVQDTCGNIHSPFKRPWLTDGLYA